ncbi:MAG TPA: hypothetical protein VNZ05_08360, partial [Solirubrobacteraceae bacterium]|nr:hypothetical protein [Solirubrobacteraceae bacterium]
MQDVIFGGAPGVQARTAAEVEIVLENSGNGLDLPLSEISIVRRLDRSGEGSYRLNGARCRLTDVIEALSDTGLGKETHSVISQGRVEEIVTSKPRERRLLIEEAAGVGKHRKRRRRAQLKLERTQQNLDRALDVEREARSRLRPLKRQAEAAELHARLERQVLEGRLELARERARTLAGELAGAEQRVGEAREGRSQVEAGLRAMSERRAQAERALAERAQRHDALAEQLYRARSAHERLQLRREQALAGKRGLEWRMARALAQLSAAGEGDGAGERPPASGQERIAALEAELRALEGRLEGELQDELSGLREAGERAAALVREREAELGAARQERARADELVAKAREGSVWSVTWQEVRRVIADGLRRALASPDEGARGRAVNEAAEQAEQVARGVVEYALKGVRAAEEVRERAEQALLEAERAATEAHEQQRRTQWLTDQRRAATEQGPTALRRAQLAGELDAERRQLERFARERAEAVERSSRLRERREGDAALLALSERLAAALEDTAEAAAARVAALEGELSSDTSAGEQMASELRACAAEEAEIQARLGSASEAVTEAEVAAQRVRDQAGEAQLELGAIAHKLGLDEQPADQEPLEEEQLVAIGERIERLERRRELLGPVNPLAGEEYAAAVEHVEEMESRREDLETAMRELRAVIADTDREIQRSFEETFQAAADNFRELVGELFPGGSGSLRLVREASGPRAVLGGQPLPSAGEDGEDEQAREQGEDGEHDAEADLEGVEIEIAPAGKSPKRLSLLSGGE